MHAGIKDLEISHFRNIPTSVTLSLDRVIQHHSTTSVYITHCGCKDKQTLRLALLGRPNDATRLHSRRCP